MELIIGITYEERIKANKIILQALQGLQSVNQKIH